MLAKLRMSESMPCSSVSVFGGQSALTAQGEEGEGGSRSKRTFSIMVSGGN